MPGSLLVANGLWGDFGSGGLSGADGFFRRETKDFSVWSFLECFLKLLDLGTDDLEVALVDLQFVDIPLMPDQRLQSSELFPENTQFVAGVGIHKVQKYNAKRRRLPFGGREKPRGPGLAVAGFRVRLGGEC